MVVQPPGKVPGAQAQRPSEEPDQSLQVSFVNKLDSTTSEISLITNSPHLIDSAASLSTLATSILSLAGPASSAAKLDEALEQDSLKDAGEIVTNVLTQPLHVSGSKREISLLEAAKNFDQNNATNSDLRKIMQNFIKHPEETKMILHELDLLIDELS